MNAMFHCRLDKVLEGKLEELEELEEHSQDSQEEDTQDSDDSYRSSEDSSDLGVDTLPDVFAAGDSDESFYGFSKADRA